MHLLNTTFALTQNAFDFKNLTIQKNKKNRALLIETKDKKAHLIPIGFEAWNFGEAKLMGPYLLGPAPVNFGLLDPLKLGGSCRWLDEQTLELTVRY